MDIGCKIIRRYKIINLRGKKITITTLIHSSIKIQHVLRLKKINIQFLKPKKLQSNRQA